MPETMTATSGWTDGSRPEGRSDLHRVDLDGETVLYDPRSEALHRLTPLGTVVWNLLDGEATIRETVVDLSEVTGSNPAEVHEGVLRIVRDLGERGLLVGTEPPLTEEPASGEAAGAGEIRFEPVPPSG